MNCLNGGKCVLNSNGIQSCHCQYLYSGSQCQNCNTIFKNKKKQNFFFKVYLLIDNNPCNSYPCLNNGICILNAIFGTYTCTCIGQYTGPNCGSGS